MVAVLTFAVRYAAVLPEEARRLQVARAVRGGGDGRLRQLAAVAAGAGTLFVRGYERGARVQRSMVVRGWTGTTPAPASAPATARQGALGRNGAGKTTLALHLVGVAGAPAGGTGAGRVVVGGVPLTRATLAEARRRVGIVLQDTDDQLFMPTVRDDVAFGPANLGLSGDALRARVDRALGVVGLADLADRAPHHLSLGQRRRAALATTLAMEPDVLVLDEPTGDLGPAGRRELADVLETLPVTLLVITHDLPCALQLCERSVLMDAGRAVADGPTRELLADDALLRAHGPELPYGFDPLAVPGPETQRR